MLSRLPTGSSQSYKSGSLESVGFGNSQDARQAGARAVFVFFLRTSILHLHAPLRSFKESLDAPLSSPSHSAEYMRPAVLGLGSRTSRERNVGSFMFSDHGARHRYRFFCAIV